MQRQRKKENLGKVERAEDGFMFEANIWKTTLQ